MLTFKGLLSILIEKVRKVVLRSRVYDDDPMELRFAQWQRKKVYDIHKKVFTLSIKSKDDIYKYLLMALAIVAFFLLAYWSETAGISDYEWRQAEYAQDIVSRQSGTETIPYLQNHGLWLDELACRVTEKFALPDVFVVRHHIAAFFGWCTLCLLGVWLMRLLNWRAAFFGTLFLFISPRFVGEAICNLHDIPFAFAYLFTCYQIYRFGNEIPYLKWRRLLYLILGLAFACSLSFGGGMLFSYLFLFLLLYYFLQNPIRKFFTKSYLKNIGLILLLCLGIAVPALVVAGFVYPGHPLPPFRFSDALQQMTANNDITCQLFEKELIWSDQAPHHFLNKTLFISTPFIILIAFVLFFIVLRTAIKKMKFVNIFVIFLIFFHPIWYVQHHDLNIGEGFAQFIFVYPPLVLLATAGWESLLQKIDDRYTNFVLVGGTIFLSLLPLRHLILNNAFSSIYFNEISGGIHNAYGNYELDPGRHSNKFICTNFIKELQNNELREFKNDNEIVVCTNGNKACAHFFADTTFIKLRFCEFEQRQNYDWDFFIVFPNQISSYQMNSNLWISENYHRRLILLEKKPVAVYLKNKTDDKAAKEKK